MNTAKEEVRKMLDQLPDDAPFEDSPSPNTVQTADPVPQSFFCTKNVI